VIGAVVFVVDWAGSKMPVLVSPATLRHTCSSSVRYRRTRLAAEQRYGGHVTPSEDKVEVRMGLSADEVVEVEAKRDTALLAVSQSDHESMGRVLVST
jgi:hypothetical protein